MADNERGKENKKVKKGDGIIAVTCGRSRHSKDWRLKEMLWSELVTRLKNTQRTNESVAEYKRLSKKEKGDIKDVGGFIGGKLKSGRRTANSVSSRQLVTLDIDFATSDIIDIIPLVLGECGMVIYSTHSHTKEKPRFRLVLPLDREVSPDEYQAISRRIAGDIGIELFDNTTYEPNRLMFWPSTPIDGEYICEVVEGEWLSADKVLGRYADWRNHLEWPFSQGADVSIKRAIDKQGDPTAKTGVVGAFCRCYSVTEAIRKCLPEIYTPSDVEGRYTFIKGTTSAGVVIYDDDKFLYSHHATDPCSGRLVNAFDLVRIHKFGELDEGAKEGTPVVKAPSYLAMLDFALSDEAVKIELNEERLRAASLDFEDVGRDEESAGDKSLAKIDGEWLGKLVTDKHGAVLATPKNIKLILANDPNVKGAFALDDFAHRIVALRDLPWRKLSRGRVWSDEDDAALRNYLMEIHALKGRAVIDDVVAELAVRRAFHPIRDYLNGLTWDKVKRVETLFIDYLGAEDTLFNRAITRKTLAAAVGRILNPGIKFDTVLTFVGKQGQGKSTIVERLGRGFTSSSLTTVQGKEAMEHIQGFWLIELAELAAIGKADFEAVKQFISKQEDAFRAAYGRHTNRYPRQCVFFATTNKSDFIRDQSGGRRWWPMNVDSDRRKLDIFQDLTDEVIGQVWAEAIKIYEGGEPLYLTGELAEEAMRLQEGHTEESPLAGIIRGYLAKPLPDNWAELDIADRRDYIRGEGMDIPLGSVKRERVCAIEIWVEALNGDPKRLDRLKAVEINDVVRRTKGWVQCTNGLRFGRYGYQKGFIFNTKS